MGDVDDVDVIDVVVLGPLRVGRVPLPTARQQRLVFAALAESAPRPVSPDLLIDGLWGDDAPADSAKALQVVVARLRRAIRTSGVDIVLGDGGYVLRVQPQRIDVAAFRAACQRETEIPGGHLDARRGLLETALALCDGEPFGDLADEPLLTAAAREVRLRRDDAIGRLHEVRLAQGEGPGLVPELVAWAEGHAVDEAAWCRLAVALHRAGRITDAMRTLHCYRRTVRETAGLEPTSAVAELEARLLSDDSTTVDRRPLGNLRVPTAKLFGRSLDVRSVTERIGPGTIVTIVGTGGVGKTTLALHAAAALRGRHRDGLWFCELADIDKPDAVMGAVASTLGVPRQRGLSALDSVIKGFSAASALVVFDNCEHLLDAVAAVVTEIASGCPDVAIVVTSRVPLGVRGEVVHPLEPLDVAAPGGGAAVELFIDRARSAGASLGADPASSDEVEEICRRLDGLPLAIELAAARARVMSVPEIRTRLADRLQFLGRRGRSGSDRHRTLWDAIDWSYRLLDPVGRELFSALSVFLGGFTTHSAAAVTGQPEVEVETRIWDLVDHSLVVLGRGGTPTRYQVLETLRQFGHEQLVRDGRLDAVRVAHLRHYVDLVSTAQPRLRGPEETAVVPVLTAELANLRTAHLFAVERSMAADAATLVTGLHEYAEWRQFFELGTWAEATLVLKGVPATELPTLHAIAGWGRCIAGDYTAATEHAEAGLAAESDGRECGWLHDVLAHCGYFVGDDERGLGHGQTEIERARIDGDSYRLAYVLADRGTHASFSVADVAESHVPEALALAETTGCPSLTSMAYVAQGFLHRSRDETMQAISSFQRAADIADSVESTWTSSVCRGELAVLLALYGDSLEALELAIEQFHRFRRAGDDGRTRGAVRKVIPALHRLVGPERWLDLAALYAGTRDRPMIEDPHVTRAVEEIMVAIEDVHGTAAVNDATHHGSAMTDQAVFDLTTDLTEIALDRQHASRSDDPDTPPSPTRHARRALSTVLFTDIVASTAHAAEVGDTAWRDVLDKHDRCSTDAVSAHHGQLVKNTGDGIMATFDRPTLAIECARTLTDRLASAGIVIRAGIHTGEVEIRESDIGGIAVHIAARIAAAAEPREILVSHTVRDLAAGADVAFHQRGPHQLKGVPDSWELFAATDPER